MLHLTFVIPVKDEQPTIRALYEAIRQVLRERNWSGEFVWIDDGSVDGSWTVIAELAAEDPQVKGLRFRKNFGKAAALAAGFAEATGDVVFTLDADLQDDPAEIPRFIEKLDEGFDVVSGWKRVRHDPWHKRWPSLAFNRMVGRLTGVRIHDHNCGFKAYRAAVVRELTLYGEMHRFVPVLAAAEGFRVGEIPVQHHPRRFGSSKYGMKRLVKGFLDLTTIYFLTGFGMRPLHLLGTVGLIAFSVGGCVLLLLTVMWCVTRTVAGMEPLELHKRAIFYYAITSILLGAQFLTAGLLAEMLTAIRSRSTKGYSIAERAGAAARDDA